MAQRMRQFFTRAKRAAPFVAGALGALFMLLTYNLLSPNPRPLDQQDVKTVVQQVLASATVPPALSVAVNQVIRPSLVLVQTYGDTESTDDKSDGLGSGVVVNEQGLVLTALHVVENAERIALTFADGTKAEARIVVAQPKDDIAVLLPSRPPQLLVPATLGNPKAMRIGDEAFVVGNPLGLYGSMSAGVISGIERSFQPEGSEYTLEGLIQIDAAVNPGSSGGPLLNRYGEVVGIITALVNPAKQESFSGIGFAVPINVAGGAAGLPSY